MKAYTLQITPGEKEPFSQELLADSLGEAIDKAKATARLRLPHARETEVSITEGGAGGFRLWRAMVAEVRTG